MPKFESSTLDTARGHRPVARISPSSRAFVVTTLIVTLVSFAASFAISGASQVWAARTLGLEGILAYCLIPAIDGPLVAFALSAISRRAVGQSVWMSFLSLGVFSVASILVNLWHGLSTVDESGAALAGVTGVSILVPVGILLTSESVLGILVAPPSGSAAERRALQQVADRGLLGATSGKPTAAQKADAAEAAAAMVRSGTATRAQARKATGASDAALRKALGGGAPTVAGRAAAAGVAEFRL